MKITIEDHEYELKNVLWGYWNNFKSMIVHFFWNIFVGRKIVDQKTLSSYFSGLNYNQKLFFIIEFLREGKRDMLREYFIDNPTDMEYINNNTPNLDMKFGFSKFIEN